MTTESTPSPLPESEVSANGSAWAALLSAAIGGFFFAVLTDASEASPRISRLLNWYHPSGALSGVGLSAILLWAVTWAILHARWNGKLLQHGRRLVIITCLLVLASLVATFPPFYELLLTITLTAVSNI